MAQTAITQILTLQNISSWSKKDLSDLALASVEEVAETGDDTLALLALAAKLEHYAGEVKKAAKSAGLNDLAKFDRAGTTIGGVKLNLKETGVEYDYSTDPIWQQMNAVVLAATEGRKRHEGLLKSLPVSGMGLTHPETGETYVAYPPLRKATESIQATIL